MKKMLPFTYTVTFNVYSLVLSVDNIKLVCLCAYKYDTKLDILYIYVYCSILYTCNYLAAMY